MAKRSLYLHEVVDVIGQGQYDYMEHLWQDPVLRMPEMNNLLGAFYVCAQGGGRWPQVINIWDCGDKGWESWGRNVDRLNLKRRNAFYGDWWDKAAQWRSGGFDRLLAGVPGSPTTSDLVEKKLKGTLFVHEVLDVRAGTALEFLAANVAERVPLWREYEHEPVGLYEVVSNPHEVVMVWSTNIPAQIRLHRNRDTALGLCDEGEADERIVAWERRSAEYTVGGTTQVMTPLPRTIVGPADWEDASLEMWFGSDDTQPTL